MKILVICQYYYPEPFRITDICEELVKRGHEVTVVTGTPNYPMGEIYDGYENKKKTDEIINGVKVHRCSIVPRKQNILFRFLNYYSYAIASTKYIKTLKDDYDVVFVNQLSPVMMARAGIKYKKLHNKKLVMYCLDLWPVSLTAGGMNENSIIYKFFKSVSKQIYKSMDYILCTSPSFIEYNHKVHSISYDKQDWCIHPCIDSFNKQNTNKKINNRVDLMFAGNIGKIQNVQDIIKAYNELKYPNLFIHIYGDGTDYNYCLNLVKEFGLEKNVILYGRIDKKELLDKYKEIDACILTLSNNSFIGNTIPAKLIEYMSASKPILAAIGGDAADVIEKSKCGICSKPDDYMQLAKVFDEYYNNIIKYKDCGKSGRDYFSKHCTVEIFVDKLEKLYESPIY